ncbi:hypothetical protein TIFTF001_002000 [Ficus carica]|uniref:Uncharacterized protein n=1 Tax=Ficus carica TaxID=3494 RepID=A0AA88CRE0_FICCA|nr:hypothetical protein TIFTF001_002000 [Ficus carica]
MVNIDTEEQLVLVIGSVDSATLISKLLMSGKHAELWSAIPDQPGADVNGDHAETQGLNNVLISSNAKHPFPTSLGGEKDHGWGPESGGGDRFVGLESQEFGAFQDNPARPSVYMYDQLPPMTMTKMQAYTSNDPLPPTSETSTRIQSGDGLVKGTMDTNLHDWSTDYSMSFNGNEKIYALQPQTISSASNLIPPYTEGTFMFQSAEPHDHN